MNQRNKRLHHFVLPNDASETDDESLDEKDSTYSDSFDSSDHDDESDSTYSDSSDSSDDDDENVAPSELDVLSLNVVWKDVPFKFIPRKTIPEYKEPTISCDENFNEKDVFMALFPKSLFMWISSCTNERLKALELEKQKKIPPTDYYEIMVVIGCLLIMSYNRVPRMKMLWSNNKSTRNDAIKSSISRDRCLLIVSKLYFNVPEKPAGVGKTYYTDELLNCLKYTFNKARSEATFQSIDESMIKFNGRSMIKQFVKDKPVDRGVKGWCRADARTGYVYDFNVYTGRQLQVVEGTLGERVVGTLCSTIREPEVAIVLDRFFMSVTLQQTISFACVGTVMAKRKNLPKMTQKLQRGESCAMSTTSGIICYKWQDTKEVMLLSNCHKHEISTCDRKQKDGSLKTFDCPQAINFYNEYMAGVDKSDQYSTYYEIDRKTNKWWKRVFYRLLMIAVSNSWIIYKQSKKNKMEQIEFLEPLAEQLLAIGVKGAKHQRKANTGRPSKRPKYMLNVGHHRRVVGETMRRCRFCASKKIQKRTKNLCYTCDAPLCITCFDQYHDNKNI